MTTTPKNIQFQERDRCIFTTLVKCGGLLDSQTIHARFFPDDKTGESCLRRLRLFCQHQLLIPYRPAITFGPASRGRLPAVYRLTARGAEFIQELTGHRPAGMNGQLSALMLHHRLGLAKLRLLVDDACAHEQLPAPLWIGEYDPQPGPRPSLNAKLSLRYRLCQQYSAQGVTHTCWPDAATLIRLPAKQIGTAWTLLMLWEYDRSTEHHAQVIGKLPGYRELLSRQDERRYFADSEVQMTRVFFRRAERRTPRQSGEGVSLKPRQ